MGRRSIGWLAGKLQRKTHLVSLHECSLNTNVLGIPPMPVTELFDAAQVFGTMRFQLNTARCHLIHAALHISYVCLRPELSDKKHHKKPVVVQIDD